MKVTGPDLEYQSRLSCELYSDRLDSGRLTDSYQDKSLHHKMPRYTDRPVARIVAGISCSEYF